jgi:hypothetical protein
MILSRWAERRAFGAAFGFLRPLWHLISSGFCHKSGERGVGFKIYFTGRIVPTD